MNAPSWGIVSTIKAADPQILEFVAYHLSLGADHIWIYLDEDAPGARERLRPNDRVSVFVTDEAYWQKRGRRPLKHQVRQTTNATRTYRKLATVDWLTLIDVDEFLWPLSDIRDILAATPQSCLSLRLRAIEAMAPHPDTPPPDGGHWYKACATLRRRRIVETDAIYPEFGPHMNGGFLSHVEGKIFARTGLPGAAMRLHNLVLNDKPDESVLECPEIHLCHHHAPDLETWLSKLPYRRDKGAYRPDIRPNPRRDGAGLSIHELLDEIERSEGMDGLCRFYNEVCRASPELCARLAQYGYLLSHNLRLSEHVSAQL